MLNTVYFIIECIGVVSFALTGTIVAIRKKADVVGALFFALLTAFGGGLIRDVVVGQIPRLFTSTEYYILAAVCAATSLVCFHLAFIGRVGDFLGKHQHNFFLELTDAMGLAVFCVLGVDVGREMLGEGAVPILLIFCGFVTGTGGGILRDICSAEVPSIFRKHIYLIPAVLGSTLYTLTYPHWPPLLSVLVAVFLIILIRVLATVFKWNMPTHKTAG